MDPKALPAQVIEALRRGNKIEAIKLLREVKQVGLAEAKGVIDALESHANAGRAARGEAPVKPHASSLVQRRPHVDDLGPGEAPRSSLGPAVIAIVLAIIAFSVWIFIRR